LLLCGDFTAKKHFDIRTPPPLGAGSKINRGWNLFAPHQGRQTIFVYHQESGDFSRKEKLIYGFVQYGS
jgi:hypothetical protein